MTTPETATSVTRLSETLGGPALSDGGWHFLEYPMGDDAPWVCCEPDAEITVADGACSVDIAAFQLTHAVQPIDNCKFVALSGETFEVPDAGTITVSAELSAAQVGPVGGYRDGFAALVVLDPTTGLVFDIGATGREVMAIHEQLPVGPDTPFTRVVDLPLAGIDTAPDKPHRCTVTLNRGERWATWSIDGIDVFDAHEISVPAGFVVGLGVFTLVPTGGQAGTSIHGQGLRARWADISVTRASDA